MGKIFKPAPWWKFWNPMSGFAGGSVFGVLIFIVARVAVWLWK